MQSYTLPPPFIDTPAAWRGEEISKRPDIWTRHLSDAEVSELEQAAERYLAKHETIGAITAKEFVLPHLGSFLADLRRTMISGIGFQLVKGVPVERYSLAEAAVLFCGIGAHLGHARSQNAQGHILGHVRDVGADAENPTTRIYQTSQRQTFHTDSADVVGLLCLKDAKRGGDSLLVSTVTVYNEMFRLRPDLATLLFEPIATDRRGEVPEGGKPYFEIPVFNWLDDALTGIYQRQYIDSAQRFDDAPRLTAAHVEALDLFDQLANDPRLCFSMRLEPGDMQFVYNHALMHDRTGFEDWEDPRQKRHLLRLWLSIPEDRRLPESFKQRYGSITPGDRGGIITRGTRLHVPLDGFV